MAKVLTVDNKESISFSLSAILNDEGYEVISAEHPIDGAVIYSLLITENGMDIIALRNCPLFYPNTSEDKNLGQC